MTLGEYIKQYRELHGLSQRQFAHQCNVSNGYISMLEKNMNPKTGKPLTPQVSMLLNIAAGMGMTLSDLLTIVDDMPVVLVAGSPSPLSSASSAPILELYERLNEAGQQKLLDYAQDLVASGRYNKA